MIVFASPASDEAASADGSVEVGAFVAEAFSVHPQSGSLDALDASVLKIVDTVSAACMTLDASTSRIHHSSGWAAALTSKRSSENSK